MPMQTDQDPAVLRWHARDALRSLEGFRTFHIFLCLVVWGDRLCAYEVEVTAIVRDPDIYNQQVKGTRSIINGVKKAGVKRPLFVGGAGSLEVKPCVQSVDLRGFPRNTGGHQDPRHNFKTT